MRFICKLAVENFKIIIYYIVLFSTQIFYVDVFAICSIRYLIAIQ